MEIRSPETKADKPGPMTLEDSGDDPIDYVSDNATDDASPAVGGRGNLRRQPGSRPQARSPDGRWEAYIKEANVWIRASGGEEFALSHDGTAEDAYGSLFYWSPDSKKLVAVRTKKITERTVYFIESSPRDQCSRNCIRTPTPSRAIRCRSNGRRCSISPGGNRCPSRIASSTIPGAWKTTAGRPIPAASPSSTTSAGIRPCGSWRSMPPAARSSQSSMSRAPPSSITRASTSCIISIALANRSGCRNATAGTTSICTTPRRGRSRTRLPKVLGSCAASTRR